MASGSEGKEEWKSGCLYSLQRHIPHDLKASCQPPFLKNSPTSQKGHSVVQDSSTWTLGDTQYPTYRKGPAIEIGEGPSTSPLFHQRMPGSSSTDHYRKKRTLPSLLAAMSSHVTEFHAMGYGGSGMHIRLPGSNPKARHACPSSPPTPRADMQLVGTILEVMREIGTFGMAELLGSRILASQNSEVPYRRQKSASDSCNLLPPSPCSQLAIIRFWFYGWGIISSLVPTNPHRGNHLGSCASEGEFTWGHR